MRLPRFISCRFVGASVLVLSFGLLSGCETPSLIDPGELQPGQNYRQKPLLKPILDNLDSGIEEPSDEFVSAGDPKPEDLVADGADYVIGKSDLVSVSITDLVAPGVETVKTTRVSESGNLTLPLIGQVRAEGLTEAQLEEAVVEAYRKANIIQKAQVSVTVSEARARTFSILGSVGNQGQFAIVQSDFRMLDALVLARDVLAGAEFVYVLRQEDAANAPATQTAPDKTKIDDVAPRSMGKGFRSVAFAAQDVTPEEDMKPVAPVLPTPAAKDNASPKANVDAEPVQGEKTDPSAKPQPAAKAGKFEFKAPAAMPNTRVIKIPVTQLKNGDLKYNVVIRPRDLIMVPSPAIGEYYMGGHVARVGVYSLSGRHITLKQAIVSAGMLDGIAIPQRTEIVRRIGTNQEVFVRVDLAKVYAGDLPDIFLKPNDVVQVGTNFFAPFIAAIRGGFRFTYGFGFLYDRNFATRVNTN